MTAGVIFFGTAGILLTVLGVFNYFIGPKDDRPQHRFAAITGCTILVITYFINYM